MKRFIRIIDKISGICGGLAGLMLCGGLALTAIEIVLRSGFSKTLFITDEYSGYLMCGVAFCGLSYTLREKGHIRMTFVHKVVSNRGREYLDLVCYGVGTVFCAVITWFTGSFFWDSIVTGSQSMQISETYLAIPQFFMPFGALIMTLQFVAEFLKTILKIKDDTAGLTIHEEIADLGR
jgi:TRAP-type C4-dicarboxylate transport system permease small subunit